MISEDEQNACHVLFLDLLQEGNMSSVIQPFLELLQRFSQIMPLPWFAFFGSLMEEIIAPIPSPLVMTLSGSLVSAQKQGILFLLLLATTGAIGKTIGSYVIYLLADKAEDFVLGKFGRLLGVSHKEVEVIGKYLNKGRRDDVVLFLLRAIPIIPTAPVSLVCGLVKLKLRTYLLSTLIGTWVRNMFYLYLGFTSLNALDSLNQNIDSFEKFGYLTLLILFGLVFLYVYKHRKKNSFLSFLQRHHDQQSDHE